MLLSPTARSSLFEVLGFGSFVLVFHAFLFSFIHNTLPLSFSKFAFDDLPSPLSHLMPHHLFTPSYRADLSGFVSTLLRPYRSSHLVAVHANITLLDHNIPYLLLVYITLKLYPTIQSNPIQSNSTQFNPPLARCLPPNSNRQCVKVQMHVVCVPSFIPSLFPPPFFLVVIG